jgi:hypothetical protein
MIYKSNIKYFIIAWFIIINGEHLLDLICGLPTKDIVHEIIVKYSFSNLPWVIGMTVIYLIIAGAFCNEVIETEDSYIVKCMLGLITYTFLKKEIRSTYSDLHLLTPTTPHIVSNEHIKITNGRKTSIIYPIGTRSFKQLSVELEKIKTREPVTGDV